MKIASKGYNLKITSWENDADNYCTKVIQADSKEQALAFKHVCDNLFESSNRKGGGIGNLSDYELDKYDNIVSAYVKANPDIIKSIDPSVTDEELADHDAISDILSDIKHEAMGGSEYYLSRVCESAIVYYVKEDVYAEVIS